jgi:hypothetical protein
MTHTPNSRKLAAQCDAAGMRRVHEGTTNLIKRMTPLFALLRQTSKADDRA